MDGKVSDFFNEINQIAPPKEAAKKEQVWQECYDNSSGYTYYWNIKTDIVTWEMPEEYKTWKEQNSASKSSNLYIPPKSTPLFPSTAVSSTKIYKIQEDSQNISANDRKSIYQHQSFIKDNKSDVNSSEQAEKLSPHSDLDEQKPTIDKHIRIVNIVKDKPRISASNILDTTTNSTSRSSSDNDDDTDLLTQIQNRAKILKDLGGELPPDVEKLVEQNGTQPKNESQVQDVKEKKEVTGFSLLAGYGNSDEEDDNDETKTVSLTPLSETSKTKTAHSTLFPITEPIDIKQFGDAEQEQETQSTIDTKAFARKRRIDVNFVSNIKKSRKDADVDDNVDDIPIERKGLGFNSEKGNGDIAPPKINAKINYPGFKSGGVMFVKSDVLNPVIESENNEENENENTQQSKEETVKTVEEIRKTLSEKLNFLSEGRESVSPVQVMVIQMETLYEAMKDGSLTVGYIHKWLKETCSELVKLEKDAAPTGWLLQWDRVNKRYYYRNQQSGESQWEYPQPDIVGGEDAMDISTTPPPVDDTLSATSADSCVPAEPPLPPKVESSTPPPPPSILKDTQRKTAKLPHKPIVADEISAQNIVTDGSQGEPLPPGVDSSEVTSYQSSTENDALGSALDSFYSDIAALETQTTTSVATVPQQESNNTANTVEDTSTKKKKKTKVKLVQGLAMKKKGVSKLVERWKSVQKDYNN